MAYCNRKFPHLVEEAIVYSVTRVLWNLFIIYVGFVVLLSSCSLPVFYKTVSARQVCNLCTFFSDWIWSRGRWSRSLFSGSYFRNRLKFACLIFAGPCCNFVLSLYYVAWQQECLKLSKTKVIGGSIIEATALFCSCPLFYKSLLWLMLTTLFPTSFCSSNNCYMSSHVTDKLCKAVCYCT